MILTFDIGNSSIKTGAFENDKLQNRFRIKKMEDLFSLLNDEVYTIAAFSSVVPLKSEIIKENNFKIPLYQITANSKFNIDFSKYSLDSLGIDRVCSLEGALSIYKNRTFYKEFDYLITIDFGTATTINIVKSPNTFLGGLIAPGVVTMFKSLQKQTAQLPDVSPDDYKQLIGTNTAESIASGVIGASVGLVNRVLTSLNPRKKKNMEIFITGGNAVKVKDHFKFGYYFDEYLNLYGIKELYKLNCNKEVID